MTIYKCDLCDQTRECVQKKIDAKYYDVCLECWQPLEAKLRGKGRATAKEPLEVFLPPPTKVDDAHDKEKFFPGAPPDTWLSDAGQLRTKKGTPVAKDSWEHAGLWRTEWPGCRVI